MSKQEGNAMSDKMNDNKSNNIKIDKKDFKDLSKRFNQITVTGFDSETGLDINNFTFSQILEENETPPTCIKFIDTKQIKGDILPKELIELPGIEAIDISNCGVREIPQVLLRMKQLRVLKASNNQISKLPNDWSHLDLTALDISKNTITELQPSIQSLEHLELLTMKDCNLTDFPYLALELKCLKTLVLNKNPISFISQTEHKLHNLDNISLKGCRVIEIPEWLTPNLHELDIRDTRIREFPVGLGCGIRALKMNHLCRFDAMPCDTSALQNLNSLDISHCSLRTFPTEILKLKNVQSLNIMHNDIHDLPRDLGKLNLRKLYIGNNPFDQFPNFLDTLLNLEVIDLSGCFFETIALDFQKLTHLKEISMKNNRIKYIPDTICRLKLSKLFLAGNFFKELPDSFSQMQELEVLDLSSTRIRKIPPQIFKLAKLKRLCMRNNQISEFPEDWGDCVNIKLLDLSENPRITVSASILQLQKVETLLLETCSLSEFPKSLLELSYLRNLYLKNNVIKCLPDNLGLMNLQLLDLEGNLLQSLPETFDLLSELYSLNLSSCRFREFPHIILELKRLKYLKLCDNYISVLPRDWKGLNLSELLLGNNPLCSIDESLSELSNLVTLHVDNCLLSDVPLCLREMETLTELHIQENNVTRFSPDALPSRLIDLNLSSNPLQTLPLAVSKCTKLSKLLCNNCGINEIPEFLLRMKELRELQIADNHLLSLPDDWGELNLAHLDVSKNVLCEVNPSIKMLTRLQSLTMSDCNIKTFPHIVAELKHLQSLILDNNPIAYIEESGHSLANLRNLSMVSCWLQNIPEWLISTVKQLDASHNSMQNFPDGLCKDINSVKLSNNQLDTIPESISCLSSLQCVHISDCGLMEFPGELLTLKNLQSLDVKDNFIHAIPKEITRLELLKELYIGKNPLDVFPDFLDEICNLEVLDITNCFLETFPFDFQKLTMLRELYAENNFISELPETLCHVRLKKLVLKDNPIGELPNSDLRELEILDLSCTKLDVIPDQVLKMTRLQELRMRNNAIEALPDDWGECRRIRCLDLSENAVASLSSVRQQQKLTDLVLESCSLSKFPDALLDLEYLNHLSLKSNLLSEVSKDIGKLQLQWLCLSDNLLHMLPETFALQMKLQDLDLSSCRFFDFPSIVLELTNMKTLSLSDNNISFLPGSWHDLNLQELSLDSNPLTDINTLSQLKSLVAVRLQNCFIKNIPINFAGLSRLSLLYISENHIVGSELKQLPSNLIELEVNNNPLEVIPDSIGEEVKLCSLSLGQCGLIEFPAFIFNFNRLQRLFMWENRLSSLPKDMQNLKLHTLNVSWNPLGKLDSLSQLKTLRLLWVRGCQLESFSSVLKKLPKLKKVDLSANVIGLFPDKLDHSNITHLNLQSTLYDGFSLAFDGMTNLWKLELGSPELLDFPDALLNLKSLKELTVTGEWLLSIKLPWEWNLLNVHLFECHNPLSDMPTGLEHFRHLTELKIRSKLDPIPDKVAQCTCLRRLTLRSGTVGIKNRNVLPTIWKCQQLLSLHLSHFSLVDIPDSLAELTQLEEISFNGCHLLVYPESLNQGLRKLKSLDIGDNEFTSLPDAWGTKHLTNINLKRAPKELWCNSLSQLKNLKVVNISYCRLRTFPEVLLQLKKLEDLNLEDNQITKLPTDWQELQLRKLNLSENILTDETFTSLQQLPKLNNLNISGIGIASIPETILTLRCLSNLDVSNNPDCKFPKDMKTLEKLEEFSASSCKLKEFPKFLGKLKTIRTIRLSNNRIKRLPSHLASLFLEEISLHGNPLEISADSFAEVPTLKALLLSECHLTDIPNFLLRLTILGTLFIQRNRIETISEKMYTMLKRIPQVVISTSNLKQPPGEVYEAGHETIERYYKDLKLGRACKVGFHNVVLLGSTTAGKTSLIKSLMRNESVLTEQEDRTIAIDEETWELTEDLTFHVIDFGGHDIYELVYPIFLKDREATIIIAVDLSTISDANVESNLFRWLSTVLSLSGTSSEIIVVGTKADQADQARKIHYLRKAIDEWIDRNLNHADEILISEHVRDHTRNEIERFRLMAVNEIRTVATSSLSMAGFDILRKILLNHSREKAVKLPEKWFDLYKSLSEQKTNPSAKGYLTIDELIKLFPQDTQGLSIHPCLKYLHQRGAVIWYENDSKLTDFVFYDINLIINVLKEVLSHNLEEFSRVKPCRTYFRTLTEQRQAVAKFRSTGIASESLLRYIWRDVANTDEIFNLVITFLKLFSLCYEADGESSNVEVDSQISLGAASGPVFQKSRILYFPWFVRNSIEEKEFVKLWPEEVPSGMIPLKFVFIFAHKVPTSLFEQFSVHLQTLLVKGHRRQDWKNTIYVTQNGIQILIHKEDQTKDCAYFVVQSRTELGNVPIMVKVCVSVVQEIQLLMKTYPGILYEENYMCPHCILTHAQNPTTLLLDEALEEYPGDVMRVSCDNADNLTGEVPAALHYPKLLGTRNTDATRHRELVQSFLLEHKDSKVAAQMRHYQMTDINIVTISKYIADDGELQDIGVNLGLPLHQIKSIRTNQQQDINLAACEVLQVWKQDRLEQGWTTQRMKEELRRILIDMNKYDAEAELSESHSASKSSKS